MIYNPVERLIFDLGTRLEPTNVVFQDADQGVQDPAAADGGGVPHRAALHDRKEEQRRDKSKKKSLTILLMSKVSNRSLGKLSQQ